METEERAFIQKIPYFAETTADNLGRSNVWQQSQHPLEK
jgi:hypothetical protein